MSNKPKVAGNRKKLQVVEPPVRMRMHSHVGDLAGCGNIRVVYPSMVLNTYYSEQYQFEMMFNNRYSAHPNTYQHCSWVTFQRSATKQQLDILKHFKSSNPHIPLLYEVDDDLMNIPEWNFANKFYKEHEKSVKSILRFVDGIVCSTNTLRNRLIKYNKNITVSPNHLPQFIWGNLNQCDDEEVISKRKPRILYAGSFNHFDRNGDKGDFTPGLIDFVKRTTDKYQWIFIGGLPLSLKDNKDIIYHGWQPVHTFPLFMKSMNPDILLAPLDTIPFNEAKSNIKVLESVAVGCPLVATKFGPYRDVPGAVNNDNIIGQIELLADDVDVRREIYEYQYRHVKDQLFWEDNDHANMFDYVNKHLRLCGKVLKS